MIVFIKHSSSQIINHNRSHSFIKRVDFDLTVIYRNYNPFSFFIKRWIFQCRIQTTYWRNFYYWRCYNNRWINHYWRFYNYWRFYYNRWINNYWWLDYYRRFYNYRVD